jgi:hypothetical protein
MPLPKTQLIAGPSSELARCMSSDRIFFMADPLVHFYRASVFASGQTTQPKTLCGRRVMYGRREIDANRRVCSVCKFKSRLQSGYI